MSTKLVLNINNNNNNNVITISSICTIASNSISCSSKIRQYGHMHMRPVALANYKFKLPGYGVNKQDE
jgi:hypothetical protein